jgi:hypothetical protein
MKGKSEKQQAESYSQKITTIRQPSRAPREEVYHVPLAD